MDPLTGVIIGTLLLIVIGGVWGLTVISSLMKRRSPDLSAFPDLARLGELQDDVRQLEARLAARGRNTVARAQGSRACSA
jgi:hypothetical protein